jgi:hypothetical protein
MRTRTQLFALTAAVFLLITRSAAATTNYNLTLAFTDAALLTGQQCDARTFDNSIVFSTSWPLDDPGGLAFYHKCFNLDETFTNSSVSQPASTSTYGGLRINATYTTHGRQNYDHQANYSSVIYHQLAYTSEGPADASKYAPRRIVMYAGQNCQQGSTPDGEDVIPWFSYS